MEELPKTLASSNATVIKKQLNQISGGQVLDVGTESGDFISILKGNTKSNLSIVGVDISIEKWNNTRFSSEQINFFQMNAEMLAFRNGIFDIVGISHTLHHLKSIETVLKEIKRVMKTGGYFILQEVFHDGKQNDSQKSDIQQHHWSSKIDSLFGESHSITFTRKKLREITRMLDFQEIFSIESTHSVKCLDCENKFKCENPRNKSVINFALEEINNDVNRLKQGINRKTIENNQYVINLLQEGEIIKKRIKKYGTSSASYFFFIAKKI